MDNLQSMATRALAEIEAVFRDLGKESIEPLLSEITQAHRIAIYGVGREGLMMRALCMRLFHLGLDVHMVGDMTTPPVGRGDVLLVSAGPGQFSTVEGIVRVAKEAGARTLCITAQPNGVVPRLCDTVIHLPAQTMADDRRGATSLLPMGSLYEAVQLIFFDLVTLLLRERLGQSAEEMRSRHTNLE